MISGDVGVMMMLMGSSDYAGFYGQSRVSSSGAALRYSYDEHPAVRYCAVTCWAMTALLIRPLAGVTNVG